MKGKGKGCQGNVVSAGSSKKSSDSGIMTLTSQQIEQLLQLLPGSSNNSMQESDTDDEIEANFTGIAYYHYATLMNGLLTQVQLTIR